MGEVVQHNQTLEPIPSWEGQKPKASGWVFSAKNPLRALRDASLQRHPSQEGDSQEQSNSDAKPVVYDMPLSPRG